MKVLLYVHGRFIPDQRAVPGLGRGEDKPFCKADITLDLSLPAAAVVESLCTQLHQGVQECKTRCDDRGGRFEYMGLTNPFTGTRSDGLLRRHGRGDSC